MNTPHSNKKKGRNRIGIQNESASPTSAETLNSQESAKYVLVRIIYSSLIISKSPLLLLSPTSIFVKIYNVYKLVSC